MNKFILKQISEYQFKQCELFTKYSVNTSTDEYKRRMQFDVDKIKNDIYYGKIAEFMVYNYLVECDRNPTTPDLNIYLKDEKSYDADIFLDNIKLHVKSHLINQNYPVSWVFQKNDPLILNKNDNEFLALVVSEIDNADYYMYLLNIKDAKFGELMKESLRLSKTCLYESDL